MQCPTCDSDHIQRQRIVYESGTTSGTATSRGTVSAGLFNSASTRSTTTSTHQTSIAAKCAPPSYPKTRYGLIIGVSTVISIITLGNYWLFGAIGISCGLIKLWRQPIYQREHHTYTLQLRRYEQSWVCHKCGEMWCEDDHTVAETLPEIPAFAAFGSEASL
jgi:hypothetical protein